MKKITIIKKKNRPKTNQEQEKKGRKTYKNRNKVK